MNPNAEVVKINDNTWRIEDDVVVRFFLLTGTEKALLIDSGDDTPHARDIARTLTNLPIELINTHGDGDHVSGNIAFDEYYIGEPDYIELGLDKRFPKSKPVFVNDGDIIDLGERKLKIVSIPGHTNGSIAVLDIDARALYVGDTVSTGTLWMFGTGRSMPDFERSLEKLDGMKDEFDVIYPSHDTPELPPEYIGKVRSDLKKALAGELAHVDEELYGMPVTTYTGEHCGFYLPRK